MSQRAPLLQPHWRRKGCALKVVASPDHQRTDPSKQWHTCPHKYQSPQPRFPHRHAAMYVQYLHTCELAHKPARSPLILRQQRTELPHGLATAKQCWPGCHKGGPSLAAEKWWGRLTHPAGMRKAHCQQCTAGILTGAISMQHNKQHAGVAGLVGAACRGTAYWWMMHW